MSLFFFPFNSSILPSVNTKLALSLVGLILLGYEGFQFRNARLDKTLSTITLWAFIVSLASIISIILNGTSDYTYATYIVSAWVWLAAAYVVYRFIECIYGEVTLRIIANFLIAVCVLQCIVSQLTASNEAIAAWVKKLVVSTGFMGIPENRLYGIGCALDVAGLKFSTVLVLLSYFAVKPSGRINKYIETSLYVLSFIIICLFGPMIARSTTIGIGLAMLLWLLYPIIYHKKLNTSYSCFLRSSAIIILVFVPIAVYYYNTNQAFHENMRFGFEGIFSLVEKGEWKVNSNEMMKAMWVWPDNWNTWLIGDGYFNSPLTNPFYIGPDLGDFYMGTDIGYCRLVFYFGIIGLLAFTCFFISCAYQCSLNNPSCAIVFLAILAVNFIGWCKVSTDIFPIFAILLWLKKVDIEGGTVRRLAS